ncbi:MAG TPA: hypothetical protein VM260_22005 [Pirellula sp.]|nr:hypothetical protein [Pirellula sp.]
MCGASGAANTVRFWATPDNPLVWAALKEAGVDLFNTDHLKGLSKFFA